MFIKSFKIRLLILSTIVFGITIFVLFNFTSVSNLEAVTFNGEAVEDFGTGLGLSLEIPILKQPLDSLSEALIARDNIARVDIDYSLPNRLEIFTNRFEPVCFGLDQRTGKLIGLTNEGRVVPIDPNQSDWELPTITAIKAGKLYHYTSDVRVRVIVEHLIKLKNNHRDLFLLITEINLTKKEYLKVSISGLPYKLRVHALEFEKQMIGFLKFLEYQPMLDETRELDLRFDDMIIQVRKGR